MQANNPYISKPWLKSYNEWAPESIEIPKMSLPQAFDETAKKFPNTTAIKFYGKKIKYNELKDLVDRLSSALYELGIRKGDTIAMLLLNSPQFIIAFYSALKIGAKITPISPVYVSPEIKYQLEDSQARDIICMDILWEKVENTGIPLRNVILTNVADFLPLSKRIFGSAILSSVYRKMEIPRIDVEQGEGMYFLKDLIKNQSFTPPPVEIDPEEDLAALLYTGGTTGWPKGAMLTHYSLLADNEQIKAFYGPAFEDGNTTQVAFGPFYHIAGLSNVVINSVLRGFTNVIFSSPDMDAILRALETNNASVFFAVPSLLETLKDYEKTNRVNWKGFKIIITGADVLLADTAEKWKERTGTDLHDCYGMSECSSMTHGPPLGKVKAGSFGVPITSTVSAIIDSKDEFVPVGEIGEIIIKGPQMGKGYWNKPDETKKQWVEIAGEVWFKTGDLAHMDEDGYFFFYDRAKDIIKYKGYQVYARQVEEVLTSHPKVKEVGVIGVPDASVGQHVKAFVVLESDARGKITENEIVQWCEDKLAHYKIPKFVEFRGEIPKTDVGKVSRRELREEELEQ